MKVKTIFEDFRSELSLFEQNNLGVPHAVQEILLEQLRAVAMGAVPASTPGQTMGALVSDAAGAALLCSKMIVYDKTDFYDLGGESFVDGHAVYLSLNELYRQLENPTEAVAWIRRGALACARAALSIVHSDAEWPVVPSEQVAPTMSKWLGAERLKSIWHPDKHQDAWRYASALVFSADRLPHLSVDLLAHAGEITEVPLTAGWANREWAPWLKMAKDISGWSWHAARRSGESAIGKIAADVMCEIEDRALARRAFVVILNAFGCRFEEVGRKFQTETVLEALVRQPRCQARVRSDAISASIEAEQEQQVWNGVQMCKLERLTHLMESLRDPRCLSSPLIGAVALRAVAEWGCLEELGKATREEIVATLDQAITASMAHLGSAKAFQALEVISRHMPWHLPKLLDRHPEVEKAPNLESVGNVFLYLVENLESWSDLEKETEIVKAVTRLVDAGYADKAVSRRASDKSDAWLLLVQKLDSADKKESSLARAVFNSSLTAASSRNAGFPNQLLEHLIGCEEVSPWVLDELLVAGAELLAPLSNQAALPVAAGKATILDLALSMPNLDETVKDRFRKISSTRVRYFTKPR